MAIYAAADAGSLARQYYQKVVKPSMKGAEALKPKYGNLLLRHHQPLISFRRAGALKVKWLSARH